MLNHLPHAPDWLESVVMPLARWLHIVATATLVGGTLFYEFVIPPAIEDLKDETQLAVLGRVRWMFRGIVIFRAVVLIGTGIFETWRVWPNYSNNYRPAREWWMWHAIVGLVAMAIAVYVTLGDRVPRHPIAWLRVAFIVMLVAMVLSAITRHVRLSIEEDAERWGTNNQFPIDAVPLPWISSTQPSDTVTTAPTTAPAPIP